MRLCVCVCVCVCESVNVCVRAWVVSCSVITVKFLESVCNLTLLEEVSAWIWWQCSVEKLSNTFANWDLMCHQVFKVIGKERFNLIKSFFVLRHWSFWKRCLLKNRRYLCWFLVVRLIAKFCEHFNWRKCILLQGTKWENPEVQHPMKTLFLNRIEKQCKQE